MSQTLSQQLLDVRKTISGHRDSLYQALGVIYAFRMNAAAMDNADHTAWNEFAEKHYEKAGWKFTSSATKNIFTTAVRLAFSNGPDEDERDAAPVSKYAAALNAALAAGIGIKGEAGSYTASPDIADEAMGYFKAHGIWTPRSTA